jgi:starch-binding outer membrane protein, SusD/RagB family
MKTKSYKFLNILFMALLLFACNDNFLETKPIAMSSEESFYTTMAAADMATTVCYSNFCMEKLWDLCVMMTLGSISSDEAEAGAGGKDNVVEFQHVDQLRHTPSEANVFEWPFGYLFRTIGYCNTALEKLPKITADMDPTYDASLIKKRLGEAHFLRAFNYFTLTQIFGGVPLVDHLLGASELKKGRDDIYKIYDLIKSDLWYAISTLPERSDPTWQIGRVSNGAAKALLAKVYLYESSYAKYYPGDVRFVNMAQHWDSAAYWAEKVITSNEYKLVGIDGERYNTWRGPNTGGYAYEFLVAGNNSSEGVFEIQNVQDGKSWFNSRGNALTRWCAPAKVNKIHSANADGEDLGWGWWNATQFLADSYETGDPRKNATIFDENDSIECNLTNDGGVAFRKPNYNILFAGTGLHMSTKKYQCSYSEYWQHSLTWMDGPVDVRLIRYADVLLFASEANFELGNQSKAVEYINMVRKRARNSGNTGIPADLASVTHDDIVKERLHELALEGHRFYDLIRWNLGSQYLNHTLADGDIIEYIPGKHEFFPIPEKEIALSGNNLQQYPGW